MRALHMGDCLCAARSIRHNRKRAFRFSPISTAQLALVYERAPPKLKQSRICTKEAAQNGPHVRRRPVQTTERDATSSRAISSNSHESTRTTCLRDPSAEGVDGSNLASSRSCSSTQRGVATAGTTTYVGAQTRPGQTPRDAKTA